MLIVIQLLLSALFTVTELQAARQCQEGQNFPDPNNCDNFYRCIYGKKVLQRCGPGTYWEQEREICEWDLNVDCKTKSNQCQHGQAFPDPNNCANFFRCIHGKKVPQSCTPGTNWNQELKICASNVHCKKKPDQCQDGQYFPDPNNCAKYFKCINGKKVPQQCKARTYWNQQRRICDWTSNVHCKKKPDQCQDGQYFPDPNNCAKYFKCINGKKVIQQCKARTYWNQQRRICDWASNVHCKTTTDRCQDGQFFPDPNNCAKFYQCVHGKKMLRDCGPGTHWNPDHNVCDWPYNVNCKTTTDRCQDGQFFPDPNNCAKFYQCVHGKKMLRDCGPGTHWNPDYNVCDWPYNVNCKTKTECQEGQLFPDPNTCDKFYQCIGGKKVLRDCIFGLYWNPERNICDCSYNVNCKKKTECQDGELFPDPNNSDKFYQCIDGKKVLRDCGPGTNWNPDRNVCDCTYTGNCNKTKTECQDGQFLPDPNNCDKYYECVDGKKELRVCSFGLYWNSDLNVCDCTYNVSCNVTKTECQDGELFPDPNNSDKFYQCIDGKKVLRVCGPGTNWNPDRNVCDCTYTGNCNKTKTDQCQNGEYFYDPENCAKFYQCVGGKKVRQDCSPGTLWDRIHNICNWFYNVDCEALPEDLENPSPAEEFWPISEDFNDKSIEYY